MRMHWSTLAVAALLMARPAVAQVVYPGNGGTGFGGPIGTGALTLSETVPGVIDFSLTAGVPFSGNALVLYFDTNPGGAVDTSTFTDTADGGRTAISGFNGGSRTLAVFPAGFGADFAATVEPGVFGGLFDLSTPGSFGFVASGGLSGSGTGPFTFSYTRAQLGLDPTEALSFVGTLISTSAYRSNETFGPSVTVPGTGGDAPNAGFLGSTTFSAANTFGTVPEPASMALTALGMGIGGVVANRRRRR